MKSKHFTIHFTLVLLVINVTWPNLKFKRYCEKHSFTLLGLGEELMD